MRGSPPRSAHCHPSTLACGKTAPVRVTLPYGVWMPQLSHPAALALVAAAALLLSGCTGDTPVVLPSPQSSTAPVFASDEEALAAAEDAYGRYLAASASISSKRRADRSEIEELVSSDYLQEVNEGLDSYEDANIFTDGVGRFDTVTLQQLDDTLEGPAVVVVYLCLDLAEVRVVDSNGRDVTPDDRPDRVPLEVGFDSVGRTTALVIKSAEIWTGVDFCEK